MKKKSYAAMAVALVTSGMAANLRAGLYTPTAIQNGDFEQDLINTPVYAYNQQAVGWYHVTGGGVWSSQAAAAIPNGSGNAYGLLSGDGTNPGEIFQSIGTYTPNQVVSLSMLEAFVSGDQGQNVTVSLYSGGTASSTYNNGYGTGYDTTQLSGATLGGSYTFVDNGSTQFNASSFSINTGATGVVGSTLWLDIATNDANTVVAIDALTATAASSYNAIAWTGSTNTNWDAFTTNFSNASGGVSFSNGLDVVFGNVPAGKSAINLTTTVMPQSITFNNSTNTYIVTGTGTIAGGTSLTKLGTASVTLGTSNSFTGPVSINAGSLILQNAAALGTSQNVTVASGATLAFQISGGTFNNVVTLNGTGAGGQGALVNLAGSNTLNGNVTINTDSTINVSAGSLTLIGNIYGNGGLTVTGAGTLYYNALNYMTGDTTVAGGHIVTDWYDSFLGTNLNVSGGGSVLVNGNGGGAIQSTNLNINGGSVSADVGGAINSANVNVTNGTLTLGANGAVQGSAVNINSGGIVTVNYYGALQGGTVNVNNGGTLNLTVDFADYEPTLNINSGGLVNASGGDAIGYGGGNYQVYNININGGTFNIADGQNEGFDTNWELTGGSMTSTGGGTFNYDVDGASSITSNSSPITSVISGAIHLRDDNGSGNLVTTVASGASNGIDLNISGAISGESDTGLDKEGPGTLALTGSDTFTGGVTVNGGTLMFGDGTVGHDGYLSPANNITLNNDANLVYNTYSAQTFTGSISSSGSTNNLTKMGPGTLVLSNANVSGTINVSAGKLYVSNGGSIAGSQGVNVAAGTTLGGNGSVNSPVTVAPGGIIEAGQSGTGELQTNGLAFTGAGTINIGTLTGYASSPAVNVNGTLSTASINSVGIAISNLTGVATGTAFQLIGYSSESGPGVGSYTLSLPRGDIGGLTDTGNQIDLTLTSIGGAYSILWTGLHSTAWDTVTANWKYNGTATDYINTPGDPVLFDDSPGSNQSVILNSGNVSPASVTFNNSTYTYALTGSNGITGNTGITLNGTSKVTLGTTNTFTGPVTINAGTLSISADANLGSPPGAPTDVVILNGGSLAVTTSTSLVANRSIQVSSGSINVAGNNVTIAGAIDGTGNLLVSSTAGGSLTLAAGQDTNTGTLNISAGSVVTLAPQVAVTPAYETQDFSGIIVNSGATLNIATVHTFGFAQTTPARPTITIIGATVTNSLGNDNYVGSVTMTGGTINGTGEFRLQNLGASTDNSLTTLPSSTTATVSVPSLALVTSGYFGNYSVNFNVSKGTVPSGVDLLISSVIDSSGTLVKNGAGTMDLTSSNTYTGGTTVNAGLLVAAQGIGSLGNTSSGWVATVNGGGLILRNTSSGTVFGLVQTGFNGGAWNAGAGITSTTAAVDPLQIHAVGMLQPAVATTFEGQPLGINDVAVKYTYYGDVNLDGKVDGSDYSVVDNAYQFDANPANAATPLTGWQNGDFNYDRVVDGSDYTLMDNAYNTQGAQISAQISVGIASQIAGSSAVPEPATLGILGMGALALLGRRKRR